MLGLFVLEVNVIRYHYEKPDIYMAKYGRTYYCDHPVYNWCTLYEIGNKGLAIIQQEFDKESKSTRWNAIADFLRDDIYLHPKFKAFFDKRSGEPDEKGIYPTVTLRQIMWALRMKPLPRRQWETVFDRQII